MTLYLDTAATEQPINLDDVKKHTIIEITDDDALVESLIVAAVQYAENYTRRALMTQTWKLKLDSFPSLIKLYKNPVQSVSSIQYVDTDGNTQTESSSIYTVDTDAEPALIYEAYNQVWSSTRDIRNAVTITFVAGYATVDDVPQQIKQALYMLIAHWYKNREDSIVGAVPATVAFSVDALLAPYRIVHFE